ncbi:MAG: hypothetical protein AAF585_19740 [Verrucomicrobiota bacterium]
MKSCLAILLGLAATLTGCAVVNSPIRVAEEAAKSTIRTAERTAELGIEILDEPFDEAEIEEESKRRGLLNRRENDRRHH